MARGVGNILFRSGKYRARLRVNGKLYSGTFGTEGEARQFLDEARRVESQLDRAPTFTSACKIWIEQRDASGQLRHVKDELSVYRRVVSEWRQSDLPVRSVTRRHVASYVEGLVKAGKLSRQTIKHRLRMIRTFLDHMADRGKVSGNVAIGVKVPRMVRDEVADRWTWLDLDEIDAVLALEYSRLNTLSQRALYAVAIYTGLRKSELWHLTRSNVVLVGHTPHIRVRGPLKTPSSRRDVPLLPQALGPLADWLEASSGLYVWPSSSDGMRQEHNDGGWRDNLSWVRNPDGTRERHVRPGVKTRAGITRRVRFHDLRHTCASHLVMGSWGLQLSLEEARDWLGHSSISVTQRYAHVSPAGVMARVRGLNTEARKRGKHGQRG